MCLLSLLIGVGFIGCSYLWVMFLASFAVPIKWWKFTRQDDGALGAILLLYLFGWGTVWFT